MNIHADNAAPADSANRFMTRDSGRAMSRKIRALQEMDSDAADLLARRTNRKLSYSFRYGTK